jgi:hypothetical protein
MRTPQHVAGQDQHQQDRDEYPAADAIHAPLGSLPLSIGALIVELARPDDPSPDHHQHHPGEQRQPEHVEHDRVGEVEVALEEAPIEEGLGDVGVDRQDYGPDEQDQEAVEDPRVRQPRIRVAPLHRQVTEQDAKRIVNTGRQLTPRRQALAAPAAVFHDRPRRAVQEHQRREARQDVPQDLQRGLETQKTSRVFT